MTVKPLRTEPVWILESAIGNQPVTEEAAAQALRTLLAYIGEDPDREGLQDTPDRVLRAYGEQFAGYKQDPAEILATTFAEVEGYQEMVLLKDIPFHSTCEHHLQPFEGKAHVAYLPGDRVVGLSKLARLVDCFARRAQIQERMTRQVASALMEHLAPRGAAVMVEAAHGCMRCRGVRKDGAQMVTSAYEGELAAPEARREFLQLVKG
jgi:GTP cyclohydrolase I